MNLPFCQEASVYQETEPFQILFNDTSVAELASLPKEIQLQVLEDLRIEPEELEQPGSERLGRLEREGKRLFRLRTRDWRVYFERCPEGILVRRILHKNTLADFLFRSNLPIAEEDALGGYPEFWKMMDRGSAR
jgi:mRNA-degrading endonuclease RelE of RelBE toxin-antitoxin system